MPHKTDAPQFKQMKDELIVDFRELPQHHSASFPYFASIYISIFPSSAQDDG